MTRTGICMCKKEELTVNETYCEIFCLCYPQFRMSKEHFERLLINEDVHIITHCDGSKLVGFALCEKNAVRLICVRPGYQRRGTGSVLLESAERYIADKGFEKALIGGVSSKFLIGADKASAGFFEKNGYSSVGCCDEMLLKLNGFNYDSSAFRGHNCAEYGWYEGSLDKLHKAVAKVNENWVQYFDGKGHIYTASVSGETASFCLVDTDTVNYLSDAYGRVGMPGCVGTVPEFRDRGIAIEMVARVTQYLKDSGMDISFIYFTGVADWYKKLGYETFMTEIFMEKQLS